MEVSTVVQAVALAYYMTGLNMVLFHSQSSPIDQPAYVHAGVGRKMFAGALWPRVTRLNHEFGWFAVTFVAACIVTIGAFWIAGLFLSAGLLRTMLVWGVLITPLGILPLALVSSVLWLVVSRPLGLKIPSAMSRLRK